jgi:hypothetical protein
VTERFIFLAAKDYLMRRILKVIILIIILLVIAGGLTGLPVPVKIEESGCTATYKMNLFPDILCKIQQFMITIHCDTTEGNMAEAENEVSRCLCDKYLAEPSSELGDLIVSRCDYPYGLCDKKILIAKRTQCSKIGFIFVDNRCVSIDGMVQDYFANKTKVELMCENEEIFFYQMRLA